MSSADDILHVVTLDQITPRRVLMGKRLIWGGAAIMVLSFAGLALLEWWSCRLQFDT